MSDPANKPPEGSETPEESDDTRERFRRLILGEGEEVSDPEREVKPREEEGRSSLRHPTGEPELTGGWFMQDEGDSAQLEEQDSESPAEDQLEDRPNFGAKVLARYYTSPSDIPAVFRRDLTTFGARTEFLLAKTSVAFAESYRVRRRLEAMIPGYRSVAQRLNRGARPLSVGESHGADRQGSRFSSAKPSPYLSAPIIQSPY